MAPVNELTDIGRSAKSRRRACRFTVGRVRVPVSAEKGASAFFIIVI
jgi:hypothetical protein